MGKVEYEKVDEIKNIKGVKKKHLTALLFSCIVAKVMFDGKDCRTQYAV